MICARWRIRSTRYPPAVAQTYVDRAGMSAEDVKAMMDAESWLGAQECIDKEPGYRDRRER